MNLSRIRTSTSSFSPTPLSIGSSTTSTELFLYPLESQNARTNPRAFPFGRPSCLTLLRQSLLHQKRHISNPGLINSILNCFHVSIPGPGVYFQVDPLFGAAANCLANLSRKFIGADLDVAKINRAVLHNHHCHCILAGCLRLRYCRRCQCQINDVPMAGCHSLRDHHYHQNDDRSSENWQKIDRRRNTSLAFSSPCVCQLAY